MCCAATTRTWWPATTPPSSPTACYLEQQGAANFYTLYRCHNYHFKAYGAMFLGQYGPAAEAAAEMIETLPAGLLGPDDMRRWTTGWRASCRSPSTC